LLGRGCCALIAVHQKTLIQGDFERVWDYSGKEKRQMNL
jgi:hypothetical protein